MKKFSAIFLSLMLIIVGLVSGCTKADNATLVGIQNKYDYIVSINEEIFSADTKLFNPIYQESKLVEAINDNAFEDFNCLKSNEISQDYVSNNIYGVLYRGLNSTFLYTKALTITNDKNVDKKYKKNMYIALENLQNHVKNLNSTKKALESMFDNDTKTYLVIADEATTKYNLEKYKNSLNICLYDLYDFNNNYNLALINNLYMPIELDDLLYNATDVKISFTENNYLINTCNLMISNYILNYSISLKENVNENKTLIENLRTLSSLQLSLKTADIDQNELIEDYKLLRMMENTLKSEEKNFNTICQSLTPEKISNNDEKYEFDKNFINSYSNKLIDYSNKLITYLQSL